MTKFRQLYLGDRFFWLLGGLVLLFGLSFALPWLFSPALSLFIFALALIVADIYVLFMTISPPESSRKLPRIMSLGDSHEVEISLTNPNPVALDIEIIDELPFQFQIRNLKKMIRLEARHTKKISYSLRPILRGAYEFGCINLFVSSKLGLVQRRVQIPAEKTVPVYPSVIQMKQYELKAFNRVTHQKGIKKIRRIGHSYEFEQIKNYVQGDDYRSINWKASSRKASLMVNQYEDERAQQVYCLIDKSRVLLMPFQQLRLLDHAINSSLAISNIVLRNHDRAGLITFSDKLGSTIKAHGHPGHLNKILQALYREKEREQEANFELLYFAVRKLIKGRSLLLLYTNFESTHALERALPVLRKINQFHLLVVIFFENTEISRLLDEKANSLGEIYVQTVARKFMSEKRSIVQQLRQYGIQSILTKAEDLSLNTINKYLELKSRGLI
ncbi:MAG: DUF58 domain-containing protein [Saprospiraceae bacterium]|nr:DUF58 domain-containing protein [Saprospiraceae bacterium]